MRRQIQQLRPDRHSLTKRGDQFLHLPVLRFRVAASDDGPQSVLGEGSNLLRVAESKERLPCLLRQSQQVHDLRDTRAGKATGFCDSGHIQIGVGRQHLPPLKSQTDRMLHRRWRHLRWCKGDLEIVDTRDGIREGMGDKRLSAPS